MLCNILPLVEALGEYIFYKWNLYKNGMSYFKQILEATPPWNNNCTATYHPSQKPPK